MKKLFVSACLIFGISGLFATSTSVTAGGLQFTPANVTINLGDTVVFQWQDGSHTTTSIATSGPDVWDAPLDILNQSFTLVLTTTGVHKYYCSKPAHADTANWTGMVGTITVNPASVPDLHINAHPVIYPNPSTGVVAADFQDIPVHSVSVINLIGQSLSNQIIDAHTNSVIIDLSALPEGSYYIRFITDEGRIETKRLLLSR